MEQLTQEITREYRLNFNNGELEWDDPIPPEVTSNVLGRPTGTVINRTSLLAWSLMSLPSVEVADLVGGGWIEIRLGTDANFDELQFKLQVSELVAEIREVRPYRQRAAWRQQGVREITAALVNRSPLRGLPPT